MDISAILERLANESAVIAEAPVSFTIAALLIGGLVWTALRWQYGARLAHRDDEIASLNTTIRQYERNLDARSPDEAAENLATLEREVTALKAQQPWTLTEAQLKSVVQQISGNPLGVTIIRDVASANLETIHNQMVAVFENAKWVVHHWVTADTPIAPHKSVTLCVSERHNRETVSLIRKALSAAKIEFGEQEAGNNETIPVIFFSSART